MTDERWARLEVLFERAVDLPPAARDAFVRDACGDDLDLRDRVLALLAHDGRQAERISSVIDAAVRLPIPADEPAFTATRCGPYRIVREIGRGGMGVVFEAERDDEAFTKRVALKVATRAAYAPEFLQRFRDERQILARLEHPHIARLLDGGTTDDGVPYFAMELVDGVPIHEYVERRQPGLAARLQLFLQVCDAVDYAHQNLVIHRDLTPRNILVAHDSVRLLDFGISKLMDAADRGATSAGLVPFTPAYCSPEQARGEAVTTRTDVYALGLVLFEILTGTRARRVDEVSPAALERAIDQNPIPLPSTTMAAGGDRVSARRLRGDLDTIVAVATQHEAGRRYASVAALADDIRRHLASQPIRARQAGVWYHAARFARRHWMPLTAAALLVAALAGGIVFTRAEARRAERRFVEVRRIANTLMGDVHSAIRDLPGSTKAQDVVVATAVQYLEGLAREAGRDAALLTEVGQGYTKVAELAFSLARPSLGRPDEAARYLERARAVLAPLHASRPDDVGVAIAMMSLQTATGHFQHETGAGGLPALEEAIATGEAALSRHPSHAGVLAVLIDAYNNLMSAFGTSPAALQHAARYLQRAEEFARMPSAGDDGRSALGAAYSQAGKVAAYAAHWDEALSYFRRNADIQAEFVAAAPYNITARRNLMLTWSNLADVALGPLGLSSYTGAGGPAVEIEPGHRAQALDAAMKAVEQAAWIHDQDSANVTAIFDYAIALGRSAPAYPAGDDRAVAVLEQAMTRLRHLEPEHPARTRAFLLEFAGSLAERQRQTGRMDRAHAAWQEADTIFRRTVAAEPNAYYPQRQLIPIVQNQAITLAAQGDTDGARRAGERAVALADEVAEHAAEYARAPGWPPRARAWLADLYLTLGDPRAADTMRAASREQWNHLVTRTDLPPDIVDEARAVLGTTALAGK